MVVVGQWSPDKIVESNTREPSFEEPELHNSKVDSDKTLYTQLTDQQIWSDMIKCPHYIHKILVFVLCCSSKYTLP